MMCLYKQPEEWMLPAGISSLQPQVKNGNSAAQCSKMWIDLPHQAHPTPVRPFLPTIHCVILPGSHWLQIKVLNLTSLYLQPYTASSSNFDTSHIILSTSQHTCLYLYGKSFTYFSYLTLIPLKCAAPTFVPVYPLGLTSLLPWGRKGGQLLLENKTSLREEMPSLVLPFNSWYKREEGGGAAAERS